MTSSRPVKRHTWSVVPPVNTGKGDGENIDRIGVTPGLNLPLNLHDRARTHDQTSRLRKKCELLFEGPKKPQASEQKSICLLL